MIWELQWERQCPFADVAGTLFWNPCWGFQIYKIGKRTMEQITNDHSRVMQEVRMGIITPTEAERYKEESITAVHWGKGQYSD